MIIQKFIKFILVFYFYTLNVFAQESISKPKIDMYPMPEKKQKRYIVNIPAQNDEDSYMIELKASKKYKKDCNHIFFTGIITTKALTERGYNYYIIDSVSDIPFSTKMACINYEATLQPITIQLDGERLLTYNSELPLVIYAPEDISLSYIVWSASKPTKITNNI